MTYEYICTACAHEWEASQPISEPALKTCPKCKKKSAKRQISGGTGFLLKGGGWYADLYSSAGAKPKEKAAEGENKAPAAKEDSKSTKAETAAPAKTADASTKPAAAKSKASGD